MAWSQVVSSTLANERMRQAYFSRNGKTGQWELVSETWRDGPKKLSLRFRMSPSGDQPLMSTDIRHDGKRNYLARTYEKRSASGSPTGVISSFAEVWDERPTRKPRFPEGRNDIKTLLQNKWIKVNPEPQSTTLDGKTVDLYSATYPADPRSSDPIEARTGKVYVEPKSGLIVRIEYFDQAGELASYSTVEYPVAIPLAEFQPPAHGPKLHDLDQDARKIYAVMAHGAPFGNGNVLRAVLTDGGPDISVFWTGTPPPGDASALPSVEGVKVSRAYGPRQFTATRVIEDNPRLYVASFHGQRLSGLTLSLSKPVGDRVTLRMPVLAVDLSRPIKNKSGKVLGYQSKKIGEKVVRDFPVIETVTYDAINQLRYVPGNR
jgi:hypothetical protein